MAGKKKPRKIYFPYDWLSKKEKNNYFNGSVVTVSNIYGERYKTVQDLEPIQEIDAMEEQKAKGILGFAKSNFTTKVLCEYWKISNGKMYDYFYKYGVIEKGASGKKKRNSRKKNQVVVKEVEKKTQQEVNKEVIPIVTPEVFSTTFRVNLNGSFKGTQAHDRILAICTLLMDEQNYDIYLDIQEKR